MAGAVRIVGCFLEWISLSVRSSCSEFLPCFWTRKGYYRLFRLLICLLISNRCFTVSDGQLVWCFWVCLLLVLWPGKELALETERCRCGVAGQSIQANTSFA